VATMLLEFHSIQSKSKTKSDNWVSGQGGTPRKIWCGCAARFPKSLFMTKICKNLVKNQNLFLIVAAGTVALNIIRSSVDGLIGNDEKVASS